MPRLSGVLFGWMGWFSMRLDVLVRLHRWISLALAPLFLVILLSGAVLALEPIFGADAARPAARVDGGALVRLLDRTGIAAPARMLHVSPDGRSVEVRFGPGTQPITVEIASGAVLPGAGEGGLFGVARDVHESLLIGAKPVVEWAARAMLVLILTGPLLSWPRLRNSLSGWHAGIGWVLFPLVLLPAGTAVLRSLDVGRPVLVEPAPSVPPLSWAEGLAMAASAGDLSRLEMARRLPGGGIAVIAGDGAAVVTRAGVTMTPDGGNWVKDLHDGVWAAPWSGWVSLASAVALLGLLGTGSAAWMRRWRVTRRRGGNAGTALLVAHASQTGTAARFAEATAEALRHGGFGVATASLAALRPDDLTRYRAVLLLASSTGKGQVPEPGRDFVRALGDSHLTGIGFTLMALGDRRYPNFCGGAEIIRTALLGAGAVELVPMHRADRDPGDAWRSWLRAVTEHLGVRMAAAVVAPEADLPVSLTPRSRVRPDSAGSGATNAV